MDLRSAHHEDTAPILGLLLLALGIGPGAQMQQPLAIMLPGD